MSKSKGNGVDPMDLMDKYGADAMRYNLLTLITTTRMSSSMPTSTRGRMSSSIARAPSRHARL